MELVYRTSSKLLRKDAVIMRQGALCNSIYIVMHGEIEVSVKAGLEYFHIETLLKYSSYGSYTCMKKEPKKR